MTKAPEKIKNIEAAIGVFENWLEENGGGASNKNSKNENTDEKVETVPGLGFKDKEAAEKTLKILEDRDPDYQKLAVKGLIGSSKRVLSGTKDPAKIDAIKSGVKILEQFLENFDSENRSRLNCAYLPSDLVAKLPTPSDKLQAEFISTYKEKKNYKHLRTLYPSNDSETSWDIVRNRKVWALKEEIKTKNLDLFEENGEPTAKHLQLIYWAYSPQPDKVKAFIEGSGKRKSDSTNEGSSKKRK